MSDAVEQTPRFKVGDELAFHSDGMHGGLYIMRIEAITKSGKLKCGSMLVNPKTMRIWGAGDWPKTSVLPVTDKIRQKIRRNETIRSVSQTKWATITDDQLNRIVAILKEAQPQEEDR
jgi:hypothetical protein